MKKILKRVLKAAGFDLVRRRPNAAPLDFLKRYGIRTVIDVGANVGQFASDIRRALPEAHIHSFEPVKECYIRLAASLCGDRHFTAYNFALGDAAGARAINRNAYAPSSSLLQNTPLLEQAFPFVADSVKEEVAVKTLDSLSPEPRFEKNILLKLDVQGYEDRVLRGAERTLPGVCLIIAETSFYPLYAGQPLFGDIYRFLAERGFDYHGALQSKRHPGTGEILFEDSIFIRRSAKRVGSGE